ncbi:MULTISPECIES: type II secretion system protein M [Shewanella]|uniref:Type II secretion system protein M n=1 Tax=Shewanella marisflavi TaxID=260364 RepID=A0AAC9XPX1_9GAMM|nr:MULTISPECIES: type II secretion system protein M [Shewanella]ASJ98317.1 type II secretion system protein M [Shewanella marisflavi]MCL1042542.1 type II secretion system protein M [Shewanella marisflavi]QDF76895.1 type II secretion system protein M [Shewanella marisflavi]
MDNIKTWWNGLVLREQQLVAACALVLVLGILYWGIWTPISQAEADAERNLTAQESTLNYVKQTANKIIGLKQAGGQKGFSGSLSAVVTQSAKNYGLEITRMQPQGNKIQIWMDEVPFDSLLDYLSDLVQQKGLSLESIDLAEGETQGFVNVRRIQFSQ